VDFHRDERNLNPFASNNWRASLVPAAAVIPAPRVYTKAVAVKTLVVEFQHLVHSDLDQITVFLGGSRSSRVGFYQGEQAIPRSLQRSLIPFKFRALALTINLAKEST